MTSIPALEIDENGNVETLGHTAVLSDSLAPSNESVIREVASHHIEVFMNPPHVAGDIADGSVDPVQRGSPWQLSSIRHHEVNTAQIALAALSQKQAPGIVYGDVKLEASSLCHIADMVPEGTADLAVPLPGPGPQLVEFQASARISPSAQSRNDGGLSTVTLTKPPHTPVFVGSLTAHQNESAETHSGDKLTIIQPGFSARVSRTVRTTVTTQMAYGELVEEAVIRATDAHGETVAAIVYRRVIVEIAMDIPGKLDEFFGSTSASTRHYNHPLGYTPGGE